MRYRIGLLMALPLLVLATACSTNYSIRRASSALDFLYPQGASSAQPASEVVLRLPVRVGLAFAPSSGQSYSADPITEAQKQKLLREVAEAFEAHEGIGHLEVIPSAYLQTGGGFDNLDRIRASLGIDLMVLLSYDQVQFTESTRASWTYLTIVGPLLIEGEKNDTRTVIDAVVYDIRSRALLFRAAGDSTVEGRSGPYNVDLKLRRNAMQGFEQATHQLTVGLDEALTRFEEQARTGTVRGAGTPAITLYDARGERISGPSGGGGGGALGAAELIPVVLLGLALLLGSRRSTRRTGG